jgi:hypothetical protein
MTSFASHRIVRGAGILSLVLVAGVIGCGPKSDHVPGDTGAAAPATTRNMSATPGVPDSTAGVSNPTGRPSNPGDTLGARGRDTTKGPKAGTPVGPPGTAGKAQPY